VVAGERAVKWLTEDVEKIFGGEFYVEVDPYKSAEKMIELSRTSEDRWDDERINNFF
jgi:hypothetical protein